MLVCRHTMCAILLLLVVQNYDVNLFNCSNLNCLFESLPVSSLPFLRVCIKIPSDKKKQSELGKIQINYSFSCSEK